MANKPTAEDLCPLILLQVPVDDSSIGNLSLQSAVKSAARAAGIRYSAATFEEARIRLIESGFLSKGKGRGGSVRRNGIDTGNPDEGVFDLRPKEVPSGSEGGKGAPRASKPRKLSARKASF